MSTTITYDGGAINPELVDGYQAARPARNLVHDILGRADPDVSFRPTGLRRGSLSLVFQLEADAAAAVTALCLSVPFTLASTDRDHIDMTFVTPAGTEPTIELDDETREVWTVLAPFQEILP